eukprot:2610466-Pleurochrysis_carterae.AAC.1
MSLQRRDFIQKAQLVRQNSKAFAHVPCVELRESAQQFGLRIRKGRKGSDVKAFAQVSVAEEEILWDSLDIDGKNEVVYILHFPAILSDTKNIKCSVGALFHLDFPTLSTVHVVAREHRQYCVKKRAPYRLYGDSQLNDVNGGYPPGLVLSITSLGLANIFSLVLRSDVASLCLNEQAQAAEQAANAEVCGDVGVVGRGGGVAQFGVDKELAVLRRRRHSREAADRERAQRQQGAAAMMADRAGLRSNMRRHAPLFDPLPFPCTPSSVST